MQPQRVSPEKQLHPAADWHRLVGLQVELRRPEGDVRSGIVDAVMPDGSGLWLAADGANLRTYIHNDGDLGVWGNVPSNSGDQGSFTTRIGR
jgi:hypothetical protein